MAYVFNGCWGFERANARHAVPTYRQPVPQRCMFKPIRARCRSAVNNHLSHRAPSRHRCSRTRHRQIVSASAAETSTRGRRGPDAEAPPERPESLYNRGRLADWPAAPGIPHPQLEIPDGLDEDDGGRELRDDDVRNYMGYSPFEHLHFSEEDITHELVINVNAPRSTCYQFWLDRQNYLGWFDMIAQQVIHRLQPDLMSYFIFYQWGKTPILELYTTLQRTTEEDELVLEESVDGMDFVAGAIFSDAADGKGTNIHFRMGYYLPAPLAEFVGAVAIYGDVNDLLEASLIKMKDFIETTDLAAHQKAKDAERGELYKELDEYAEKHAKEHGSMEHVAQKTALAADEYLEELELRAHADLIVDEADSEDEAEEADEDEDEEEYEDQDEQEYEDEDEEEYDEDEDEEEYEGEDEEVDEDEDEELDEDEEEYEEGDEDEEEYEDEDEDEDVDQEEEEDEDEEEYDEEEEDEDEDQEQDEEGDEEEYEDEDEEEYEDEEQDEDTEEDEGQDEDDDEDEYEVEIVDDDDDDDEEEDDTDDEEDSDAEYYDSSDEEDVDLSNLSDLEIDALREEFEDLLAAAGYVDAEEGEEGADEEEEESGEDEEDFGSDEEESVEYGEEEEHWEHGDQDEEEGSDDEDNTIDVTATSSSGTQLNDQPQSASQTQAAQFQDRLSDSQTAETSGAPESAQASGQQPSISGQQPSAPGQPPQGTRQQPWGSEQQAAADMSSKFQQDQGQFDQAQADRVSPENTFAPQQPDTSDKKAAPDSADQGQTGKSRKEPESESKPTQPRKSESDTPIDL